MSDLPTFFKPTDFRRDPIRTLEDVRQRGLSDDMLLVITGEFGRTSKMIENGQPIAALA